MIADMVGKAKTAVPPRPRPCIYSQSDVCGLILALVKMPGTRLCLEKFNTMDGTIMQSQSSIEPPLGTAGKIRTSSHKSFRNSDFNPK